MAKLSKKLPKRVGNAKRKDRRAQSWERCQQRKLARQAENIRRNMANDRRLTEAGHDPSTMTKTERRKALSNV